MKILLFAQRIKDKDKEAIVQLVKSTAEKGFTLYASREVFDFCKATGLDVDITLVDSYDVLCKLTIDMVITLGGDGTILGATTLIRELGIPIFGINFGRLGFLAGIEKKYIEQSLLALQTGDYAVEERSMISLDSSPALFGRLGFALNDFTLHKRDTSSMITIHTYINGDYLTSYWADGIIVATPTGSTGYSLSCGGPIVFPNSGNFIITPVAPHNLNVRPLVLSERSVISFEIEGRASNFLCTLDSRVETISAAHRLSVRKCDFNTRLVHVPAITFLKTLREKLSWGADNRN